MISRRALNCTAVAASVLLLPGCNELLPDRPQPNFEGQTAVDSAAGHRSRPEARRGTGGPRRGTNAPEAAAAGPVTDAAFDQIRRSLRVLVVAEQGFYAENGTYSEDLNRLGYRPSGESNVKFLWLTRQGWAASGTHPALPGRDCVTYVGAAEAAPTTMRFTRSGREGVVVCDAQPRPRPAGDSAAPAPPAAGPPATAPRASAPPAAAPPAAAPPTTIALAVADTGSALDAVHPVIQMKVDLRNMVPAQTAYWGTQGTYSRRMEQLQLQFAWHRGVSIKLLSGDPRAWSARATHAARPGKSCVIWYGVPPIRPATAAQRKVPERAGVPVCDD